MSIVKTITDWFSPAPTVDSLSAFIRDLVVEYPQDPSVPGLVLAWLPTDPTGPVYYLSVVRYTEKWGKGKVVLCTSKHFYLDQAILFLRQEWERVLREERKSGSRSRNGVRGP